MAGSSSLRSPRPSPARIAQARAECGYTQSELAKLADCTTSSIQKYESGERAPQGPILRRIAAATRRDVAWFFVENGEVAA